MLLKRTMTTALGICVVALALGAGLLTSPTAAQAQAYPTYPADLPPNGTPLSALTNAQRKELHDYSVKRRAANQAIMASPEFKRRHALYEYNSKRAAQNRAIMASPEFKRRHALYEYNSRRAAQNAAAHRKSGH